MSQDQALPLKLVLTLVPAWFWLCLHLSKALALFWLLFGLMSGIDSLLLRLSFSTSSLSGNRNQEQMAVRKRRKTIRATGVSDILYSLQVRDTPASKNTELHKSGSCQNLLHNKLHKKDFYSLVMVPCISHRSHLIEVILGIYTITMLSKFISGTHSLYPLSGDQLDHSLVFSLWRRGQWEALIQPFLCSGPRVWKIKGYIRCCWLFLLPHLSGSVLFFCFLVLKVIVFEESHFPAGSFVKLGLASHTDLRFSHRLPVEILTSSVH